jgi:hypothetical protein
MVRLLDNQGLRAPVMKAKQQNSRFANKDYTLKVLLDVLKTGDATKLSKKAYEELYLLPSFIAHFNASGFAEARLLNINATAAALTLRVLAKHGLEDEKLTAAIKSQCLKCTSEIQERAKNLYPEAEKLAAAE